MTNNSPMGVAGALAVPSSHAMNTYRKALSFLVNTLYNYMQYCVAKHVVVSKKKKKKERILIQKTRKVS